MKNTKKIILRGSFLVAVVIIGYLGIRAKAIGDVLDQLNDRIVQAEKQLEEEQSKLEVLEEERENMNTLEYIEKTAREELGMVKEDDIVFKKKQ